jgi:hypothetical protein
MKEVIKVIKENLSFKELPKNLQEDIIDACAECMVITFDEGVYTKRTALIDSKIHHENNDFKEYVFDNVDFYEISTKDIIQMWNDTENKEAFKDEEIV